MNYTIEDLTYIAKFLLRKSKFDLPICLQLTETDVYDFCYKANIDTCILDCSTFEVDILILF